MMMLSLNTYSSSTYLSFGSRENVTWRLVWIIIEGDVYNHAFSELGFLHGQTVSGNIINLVVWYPFVFSSMKSRIPLYSVDTTLLVYKFPLLTTVVCFSFHDK